MNGCMRFGGMLVVLVALSGLVACSSGDDSGTDVQDAMSDMGAGDTAVPDVGVDVADVPANGFDTTVKVVVGEAETVVDLSTLEATEFDGKPAIRLTRIVEVAAIGTPWAYHYNFVANDDYDVLAEKLEGDYAQLPYFGELDLGFVYFDDEKQTYRIGWDASLGFPSSLGVKGMGGGTIRAVAVGPTDVVFKAGAVRAKVDLSTLTTQDVVYYKKPEDGAQPMVPLVDVFTAAGAIDPEAYDYKFHADDGFSNSDDNLMPYVNVEHTWLQVGNRRIIPTEGWDTELCCWSTKNTVLLLGVAK